MKRLSLSLVLVLALSLMVVGTALADAGGAPGAHGLDGKDFGAAVSGLAQSAPGALAAHTSGGSAGGAPAAHGVDGNFFGCHFVSSINNYGRLNTARSQGVNSGRDYSSTSSTSTWSRRSRGARPGR